MSPVVKPTDGNFRLLAPSKVLEFTGERMTSAIEGQLEFEHLHRYCLARDLCAGLDVLDVASGEGYGSAILAGVARSVVGVDIDPRSVAHAQEAYRAENLRFLQGDAIDLPVEKASVDVVVSFETLEHIREHAQFAAEVRRVLRPAGRFIVSTPDRAIYSARGEHFNEYHLLELTETEFESFLHAHFARAIILHQRAIFGSVIAAADSGWRSYERRAHEYVEASGGLTRSPYLVGIASDADLPQIASTAYVDRRNPEEVWRGYVRAGVIESERDAARAALAGAEARAAEAEARAAEAEVQAEEDQAQSAVAQSLAAAREQERDAARAALAEAEASAAELARNLDEAKAGWVVKLRRKTKPLRRAMFGSRRDRSFSQR